MSAGNRGAENPPGRCSEQTLRKPGTQSYGAKATDVAKLAGPPAIRLQSIAAARLFMEFAVEGDR
jgi:hypothetical protein